MSRAYYSAKISEFKNHHPDYILGLLCRHHSFSVDELQKQAWQSQISILQTIFSKFSQGQILFEYVIPRMGKRVDVVFLFAGIVFVIEFKVGEKEYLQHAIDQVIDYSIDLKNFHERSHDLLIVPVLVSTEAGSVKNEFQQNEDCVFKVIKANKINLAEEICCFSEKLEQQAIDVDAWENSIYKPTPTIIEAAQALYRGHTVKEISRSDAGAINLSVTSDAINNIIEKSKIERKKSICFITGVPGAGKTLAGLNIANERHRFEEEEHAVFLSGNGPLVEVLQEALARNEVKSSSKRISKGKAKSEAKAFIQNIHHFRDDALSVDSPPIEKVVIFDEAQRAWTLDQTSSFMKTKKGVSDFNMSEPDFLISIMDRHKDWAVIICLIGGGQEINTGEAGLPEWFGALREKYQDWVVYVSNEMGEYEYTRGADLSNLFSKLNVIYLKELHLSTSIRSFRSESVSGFVKSLLDNEIKMAADFYESLKENYPIVVTRNFEKAKQWLRHKARGSERFGVVSSSGGYRLKPYGICTQLKINAANWFLNPKTDVRSSYYLEDVATEFDIQGLELDWVCLAWDADLRYDKEWIYKKFRGAKWQNINDQNALIYLKNAYRVLLTRARQGMVIFIPEGDFEDETRLPKLYDGIYELLTNRIGINVLHH